MLEYNKYGLEKFNLRSIADTELLIKHQNPTAWGSIKAVTTTRLDGAEMFQSPDLLVTKYVIQGAVMKAVENVSFFNKDKYHKRFFKLEFGDFDCHFYESQQKDKAYRSHR